MVETYACTQIHIRLKDKSVLLISTGGSIRISGGMVHVISDNPRLNEFTDYIYQLSDVMSIRFIRKEAEDDGSV